MEGRNPMVKQIAILHLSLLSLLVLTPESALAVGTENFEFLRIGLAPRAEAMGGAFVALSDGVGGMTWNPAGLSHIEDSQALAAYSRYPLDVQLGGVILGRTLPQGWSLALGLKYLSYGSMTGTSVTDPVGVSGDSFSASDVAVAVGAAYPVTGRVRLGVGATYVSGSIDTYSASAVGVDLGLLFEVPDERVTVGCSVRNLRIHGSSYLSEDISLPTEVRVGVGFRSPSGIARVGFDVAVGGDGEVRMASGGELLLGSSLWVRAGLDGERWDMGRLGEGWGNLSALSWGLGMMWDEWRVDYGISPFGDLGTVHRLSVSSEI
jgi:hypothetical protein